MSPIDPSAAGAERAVLAPPPPRPPLHAPSQEVPARAAREPPAEGVAVSLTQVGLVGRAMVEAPAPPSSPRHEAARVAAVGRTGAPRPVERVLEPWGVAMLPDEAAILARREAQALADDAARAADRAGRADRAADAAEAAADAALDAAPDAGHGTGRPDAAPGAPRPPALGAEWPLGAVRPVSG